MMKTILLFTYFSIFAFQIYLSASDSHAVPFSQFKEYLLSDSYSNKKKYAFLQLYLKTNKKNDKDGILFFQKFILNPKVCSSKKVFDTVAFFLIQNEHITKQFEEKIKKTINEKLDKSDYLVWCLELLNRASLSLIILNSKGPDGESNDKDLNNNYLEQQRRNIEYIVDIYLKTNCKVFAAAIKQKSDIVSMTDGILLDRETNKYSIIKSLVDNIEKSKNYNLLKYINESAEWSIPNITKKKDVAVFMGIADDISLSKDVRNEAASILSQIFYIQKEKQITWIKWYSDHKDSFNRVEAAKKAIFDTKLQNNIRIAAMRYICESFDNLPEKLLYPTSKMLKSTDSIELCFALHGMVYYYLEKFPQDKKLQDINKLALKNCRRIYKDYKPSSDNKIYYYIPPEKTQTPNTDAELEEFLKD